MSKVYLYSRVSTSEQTFEQQERTAYEWLERNNLEVTDVVSDEGVSGGVSYANRNLGKELLPKLQAGDILIVSEISRLGRSMFDLSKLIHQELKPRKVRLVVVSMGLDLRCDSITAMDELILNNFAFAAQLEKQLISERTLSSLQVKKSQGIKLGAASEKWKESYHNKTEAQKRIEGLRRGKTRNYRHLQSRDVQAFIKVLKNVFPDATQEEDMTQWRWSLINTKGENKSRVICLMKDYKDLDGNIFHSWDLDKGAKELQTKLSGYISSLKNSVNCAYN